MRLGRNGPQPSYSLSRLCCGCVARQGHVGSGWIGTRRRAVRAPAAGPRKGMLSQGSSWMVASVLWAPAPTSTSLTSSHLAYGQQCAASATRHFQSCLGVPKRLTAARPEAKAPVSHGLGSPSRPVSCLVPIHEQAQCVCTAWRRRWLARSWQAGGAIRRQRRGRCRTGARRAPDAATEALLGTAQRVGEVSTRPRAGSRRIEV